MDQKSEGKSLKTKKLNSKKAGITRRHYERQVRRLDSDTDALCFNQDVVLRAAEIMGYDLDYWKRSYIH